MPRLLFALLVCALGVLAQNAGPISTIDAAVVDAAGRPVTGLTPADFEVLADGKAVPVARLTSFDTTRHTASFATKLPAWELGPDQIHRTTVFVLDDLCLSMEALREARQRLHHFADDLMAPGDQSAIVRTSGGSPRERPLTADRSQLLQQVDAVEYLGAGVSRQGCSAAAWSAVAYAISGLESLSGRKAVVLMSGEVIAPAGNAASSIGHMAAASMTALYLISAAAPLFAESLGGAAGVDLDRVAAETGGYYVLSIPSSGSSSAPDVQVKVRRPGVTLRVRREPAGPPPPSAFPVPSDSTDLLTDAMNSPFEGTGIALRITPIFNNTPNEGSFTDVLCHVDISELSYLLDEQGQYHIAFEIGMSGVVPGARVVKTNVTDKSYTFSEADYRQTLAEGLVLPIRLAWGTGSRDIRAAISDQRSGRIGTANSFVDAHDLTAGGLFLSGISMDAGIPVRQSAAVRVFRPGYEIRFLYNVFNSAADSSSRSRLQVITRIFAGGRETYRGTPKMVEFEPSRDPRRRRISGRIQLDPTLGPGRYIFQITVTDLLSPQPRTASQFIDFTIEL
jgi:VWFA-related protein